MYLALPSPLMSSSERFSGWPVTGFSAPEAKSMISFLFHEKVKFDDQPKSRHWFE